MRERIEALAMLGNEIRSGKNPLLEKAILKSYQANNWFTEESVNFALNSIAQHYLDQSKLEAFVKNQQMGTATEPKIVALIPAGNIPMVGIHDLICIFLSGHRTMIKPSQRDEFLLSALIEILGTQYPEFKNEFLIVEKLHDFDAVIATGSTNTSRYFDYYFKSYPSIIRKNRNSLALLSGKESDDELRQLEDDVFRYFGLGCRNISKVYVPRGFEITRLFELWNKYDHYKHHHKFRNNFEYNNANLLLNQETFLTNDVFILKESEKLVSRISVLHYSFYDKLDELLSSLQQRKDELQCVSTNLDIDGLDTVSIGQTQIPSLTDFADGVNTIQFLSQL